jgi:hypothetical protein
MTTTRVWFGFLLAPGVPALALYIANIKGPDAPLLALILLPVAYAAALVLGLPTHVALRRRNISGVAAYLAAGALVGFFASTLMFGLEAFFGWDSAREHAIAILQNSPKRIALAIGYALVAAAVFWVIAIRNGRTTAR